MYTVGCGTLYHSPVLSLPSIPLAKHVGQQLLLLRIFLKSQPKTEIARGKDRETKVIGTIVFRQICANRSFENLFGIELTVKDVVSVF